MALSIVNFVARTGTDSYIQNSRFCQTNSAAPVKSKASTSPTDVFRETERTGNPTPEGGLTDSSLLSARARLDWRVAGRSGGAEALTSLATPQVQCPVGQWPGLSVIPPSRPSSMNSQQLRVSRLPAQGLKTKFQPVPHLVRFPIINKIHPSIDRQLIHMADN